MKMLKKRGLRVGQAPGAVANDGGQSVLSGMDNISLRPGKVKSQTKEDAMNFADVALDWLCENRIARLAVSFTISSMFMALMIALALLLS